MKIHRYFYFLCVYFQLPTLEPSTLRPSQTRTWRVSWSGWKRPWKTTRRSRYLILSFNSIICLCFIVLLCSYFIFANYSCQRWNPRHWGHHWPQPEGYAEAAEGVHERLQGGADISSYLFNSNIYFFVNFGVFIYIIFVFQLPTLEPSTLRPSLTRTWRGC